MITSSNYFYSTWVIKREAFDDGGELGSSVSTPRKHYFAPFLVTPFEDSSCERVNLSAVPWSFFCAHRQLCSEELDQAERAREYYQRGLRACPGSIPLWRLAACLDERTLGVNKARSTLEVARLRNPKSEGLWLEAVRLERRAGNVKGAESLMAKALQECPGSGVLWAEEILVAPRADQKSTCSLFVFCFFAVWFCVL